MPKRFFFSNLFRIWILPLLFKIGYRLVGRLVRAYTDPYERVRLSASMKWVFFLVLLLAVLLSIAFVNLLTFLSPFIAILVIYYVISFNLSKRKRDF